MKAKIRILWAMVPVVIVIMIVNSTVVADSDLESLEPNSYQKRDFRDNTNFLRENSLNERRESVPEEQKLLTFKQREKKAEDDFLGSLFSTEEVKSTTIQVNSEELKLFTEQDSSKYQAIVTSETVSKSNNIVILLYVFLAIAVILLMAFILPKMAKGKA